MRNNKNLIFFAGLAILIVSTILAVLLPEIKFYHMPYHFFILAILLFFLYMNVRDIFILVMVFSSIIWALGIFDIIKDVNLLLFDTLTIFMVAGILGWYETTFKAEKNKFSYIITYKEKEIAEMNEKIRQARKESDLVTDEIKKIRHILNF